MVDAHCFGAVGGLETLIADNGDLIVDVRLRDLEASEFNIVEVSGVLHVLGVCRLLRVTDPAKVGLAVLNGINTEIPGLIGVVKASIELLVNGGASILGEGFTEKVLGLY